MEYLNIVGFTVGTVGKIMVAYTAMRVHFRFWRAHRVDESVFAIMRREQVVGVIGIACIALGYLLEAPTRLP
ncbi:MAG: hypothetical protein HY435_00010 [Candidatus Liptonbacteria bacterium]|nr:hypothetical protein [Candidatus Liptonbacteria bacterium]